MWINEHIFGLASLFEDNEKIKSYIDHFYLFFVLKY